MTFTHAPAVAALGVGVYLSTSFIRDLYFALKSKEWPTTNGKVTQVDIVRTSTGRGTYRSALVRYEYEVRGVRYTSNRIDYAGRGGGWPGANRYFNRYSEGQGISVRYDPNETKRAVLETGVRQGNFLRLLYGFAVLGFALLALLAS